MSEKNKQYLTLVSIMGVLLLGGAIYWCLMMVKPEISANQAKAKASAAKTEEHKREIARLQQFIDDKEAREELARFVDQAKRRLPTAAEEQQFLQILEESLRRTGVTLARLAPRDQVLRDLYIELPYEIRGGARYHEFGQLLNVLECNPERLMRVSTFSVRNDPKRPSIHPIELTVMTFRFREQR